MNDKSLIDTLKNIKNYCVSQNNCSNCLFVFPFTHNNKNDCQLGKLCRELWSDPIDWDMNKVEMIIKGEI